MSKTKGGLSRIFVQKTQQMLGFMKRTLNIQFDDWRKFWSTLPCNSSTTFSQSCLSIDIDAKCIVLVNTKLQMGSFTFYFNKINWLLHSSQLISASGGWIGLMDSASSNLLRQCYKAQIREQMSGPDLHVFTLKFLALKITGFSPIKKTFWNYFDFCLPLLYATFQCGP